MREECASSWLVRRSFLKQGGILSGKNIPGKRNEAEFSLGAASKSFKKV